MMFCLKKMAKLGLKVELHKEMSTLMIEGSEHMPQALCEAFDDLSRLVTNEMEYVGGFEAQRLVDNFGDELASINLVNAMKRCTVDN